MHVESYATRQKQHSADSYTGGGLRNTHKHTDLNMNTSMENTHRWTHGRSLYSVCV